MHGVEGLSNTWKKYALFVLLPKVTSSRNSLQIAMTIRYNIKIQNHPPDIYHALQHTPTLIYISETGWPPESGFKGFIADSRSSVSFCVQNVNYS